MKKDKKNIDWVKEELSPKADINNIIDFDAIAGRFNYNSEVISEILKGKCFKKQKDECCPLIEGNKSELVEYEGRLLMKTYNENEYAILTPITIWNLFNDSDGYSKSNSELFDAFNVISEEEIWIRAKRKKYERLRVLLQNKYFACRYPKVMNYLSNNRGLIISLLDEAEKNIRGKEACHNNEDVFFSASHHLSEVTGINRTEITRVINGLTLLGLMNKLSIDEIPYSLLDNIKSIDYKRMNYMVIESITEECLANAELLFADLKKHRLYISKFSKKDIYKAFGVIEAERVFPSNCDVIGKVNEIKQNKQDSEIRSFLNIIKINCEDTVSRITTLNEEEFIDILIYEPEKLMTELGISYTDYEVIIKVLSKKFWIVDTLKYFIQVGFNHREVLALINNFGIKSIENFRINPYSEFPNVISFTSVDRVALSNGYDCHSTERIEYIVMKVLREAYQKNHAFSVKKSKLADRAIQYIYKHFEQSELEIKIASKAHRFFVEKTINTLEERELLHLVNLDNEEYCYLHEYYQMEEELIESIETRFKMPPTKLNEKFPEAIDALTTEQRNAVKSALTSGLTIITGGPGTGKTRTIKGIVDTILKQNPTSKVKLVAPTGIAAKRVSKLTGYKASTIHLMLGLSGDRNQVENKIEADYLIVDESSMVSHVLAHALFRALNDNTKVILVGDINQLKPVKGDSIFEELCSKTEILGKAVNKIELQKNHRQKEESIIHKNALLVKEGRTDLNYVESGEFQFVEAVGSNNVVNSIVELIEKKIEEGLSLSEIQVLSPMNRGEIGVNKLNEIIQSHFNGDKKLFKEKNLIFRVRDKVMQNKNDYRTGIMNGEIGVVKEVHIDYIVIRFNKTDVKYDKNKVKDIELAYAASIHKSQGLEYPLVIIPVCKHHKRMINRQLIYTAITRAKKSVILVGDSETIIQGIRRVDKSEDENITFRRIARAFTYEEAI